VQGHVSFVFLGDRVVLDVGTLHECILILLSLSFLCINDEDFLRTPLLEVLDGLLLKLQARNHLLFVVAGDLCTKGGSADQMDRMDLLLYCRLDQLG
jgi:hypothetical protein